MQKDGTEQHITLANYKYVPGLWVNLFSIPQALDKGWNILNQGIVVCLSKNGTKVTFDRNYRTAQGLVIGCTAVPSVQNQEGLHIALPMIDKKMKMNANEFHQIVGHPSVHTTQLTAGYYNIPIHGEF